LSQSTSSSGSSKSGDGLPEGARKAPPGRPTAVQEELVRHIQARHANGESIRQIARRLNASQTPTAHGGAQWWPSTVRAILRRASA
jgi:hypothetical protein